MAPVIVTLMSLFLVVAARNFFASSLPALSNRIIFLSSVRTAYPLFSQSGIRRHITVCLAPQSGFAAFWEAQDKSTRYPLTLTSAARVLNAVNAKTDAKRSNANFFIK